MIGIAHCCCYFDCWSVCFCSHVIGSQVRWYRIAQWSITQLVDSVDRYESLMTIFASFDIGGRYRLRFSVHSPSHKRDGWINVIGRWPSYEIAATNHFQDDYFDSLYVLFWQRRRSRWSRFFSLFFSPTRAIVINESNSVLNKKMVPIAL